MTSDPALEQAALPPPPRAPHVFSSLHYRDFRYLWAGTLLMSAGQWIQQVTVSWLVYDLTGSATLLGAVSGLRTLPFLLVAPGAGVVADRLDRRRLILAFQLSLALVTLGMALVLLTGRLRTWHLFAFTLLSGTLWSFSQPVRQAIVSNLVPRRHLTNALALTSFGFNISKLIGPTLAGFLIVWVGAGGNFLLQALTYLGVTLTIVRIRLSTPASARPQSSMMSDLKEGVRYVRSTRLVSSLLLTALVPAVIAMPYLSLMPVFQRDVLGVGADGLGLLMSAPAAGAILATLFVASTAHTTGRPGLQLLLGLALMGVCLMVFSQTRLLWQALAALTALGAAQMLFLIRNSATLQTVVPDVLRGRVMSLYMLEWGLVPLGTVLAGAATDRAGAPATLATMGLVVILLACIAAWLAPEVRRLGRPAPEDGPPS